jgi:hypothetical protein
MAGSSDSINYSVRPNKSVERKLIVDAMARLPVSLKLPHYRYIGMGAMWFVDFILVHRFLKISDMISIESDDHARAHFNRPYSCVEVMDGDSTALLTEGKLPLKDKPLIVWFDYDGILTHSVLKDLEYLSWSARPGSIFLVTVNAHKNSYRKSEGNQKMSVKESLAPDFGKLIPDPFPDVAETQPGFEKLLGKMLHNHISRTVLSDRKSLEFLPLFDFSYEDGAPMVTIGGVLCDEAMSAAIKTSPAFELDYVGKAIQYRIEVPPLTFREKHAIDQLLPGLKPPYEGNLKIELTFSLTAKQIENYRKFYPFYPLFWEIFA